MVWLVASVVTNYSQLSSNTVEHLIVGCKVGRTGQTSACADEAVT